MKAKRQMRIIELVSHNIITSQDELCELLAKEGIKVTQATISRDIKELNLVRVPTGDGRYKYALMPGDPSLVYRERFHRLFADCCVDMDRSQNIILVKTISGTASAVGEAIDGLKLNGILGTVAGDNAVLVVVKEGVPASEVLETLRKMAGL
ncbi:MAG TPA: arginine repressor [Firmicutes bacterium]|uniref:Arginine repressor n=1 Tax=Candidatus Fermentithermobacillus carboniphilus TaxID=3085328 RepID=A0AAT9LDW9_9FIRM|nr:MAG: arginine repressor [Candidatus Fermentithermobacillus carboniphilus]HHW17933.1 arginine repressor [Candidatus Fermentithermobacillaceae bacterium]